MTYTRVVFISDLHIGSPIGLTPPQWQYNENAEGERKAVRILQQKAWKWFTTKVSSLRPFDYCIVNGDVVEGPGKKSPYEIMLPDMHEQEIAGEFVLKYMAPKKKLVMIYGTPYHTNTSEKHELAIADTLGVEIVDKLLFELKGNIFNIRHKANKSSIPHGFGTLINKDAVWAIIKAELGRDKTPNFIIRSHIHEFSMTYKPQLPYCISTPALQFPKTVYGLGFDSYYDMGFIHIDIWENGTLKEICPHFLNLPEMKPKLYKFG